MKMELPWARRAMARLLAGRVREQSPDAGRVAIVKLDRLGDFVLSISAIKLLVQHYGPARCVLLIGPAAAELAQREFPEIKRIVLPASQGHARAFLAACRHRHELGSLGISRTVSLRHQRWDYDDLVLSWTGAAEHLRLEAEFTPRLHAGRRTFVVKAPGAHVWPGTTSLIVPEGLCRELVRHTKIIAAATGSRPPPAAVLPELQMRPEVTPESGVVVTPFGSEPVRDFPLPLLAAALAEVRRHVSSPIFFTGSAEQKSRLENLAAEPSIRVSGPVRIFAGLDLKDYLAVVASSRLVLTTETATAHIAAAMDREMVALIGGGHFGEFAPWRRSAKQEWITHSLECFGCDWRCVHPEPYCLKHISSERVVAAVRQHFLGTS